MYEVTVKTGFAAAHQLRLYDGKYENLHGHNWTAQVTVEADELDPIGVGIDFVKLKEMVETILSQLDYHNINDIPPFDEQNPSVILYHCNACLFFAKLRCAIKRQSLEMETRDDKRITAGQDNFRGW